MWTRAFWLDTLERALKTFAQGVVAGIGGNAVGIMEVDWLVIVSVAGTAALVSVLTSIASAVPWSPGTSGNASLVSSNEYEN